MFKIIFSKHIKAPKETVWEVILNTNDYSKWNNFVIKCKSTFQVGSPIVMKVKILPFLTITQKEMILNYEEGKLIEYGIRLPIGLLSSSRQHRINETQNSTTQYDSIFVLKGLLAPIVEFALGSHLKRGFLEMTEGICKQAQEINGS